jgi:translation initiation factor IF-1
MKAIVILTAIVVALVGAGSAGAQDNKDTNKDRGGIGGVLDTLGGILGGATSNKLHGTVVVAHDTNVVLRTDDKRTVRVDTASIDPQVRQQLVPGQSVTITTRGSGDVLTASDVQVEQGKASQPFSRVSGTVQERSDARILFKTKEGLTLPVDTSQVRGLPYIAPNTPATLIYEQGPKQEVRAVWIEPGDAAVSASPATERAPSASGSASPSASGSASPSASLPTTQKLEGLVESVGMSELTVQTSDGRHVRVDTNGVDRTTLASVRPGDIVTITGSTGTDPDKFSATAVAKTK